MISSVARALAVLDFLSSKEDGALLTTIVAETGTEKSTASRILKTLEEEGYVTRDPSGKYYLALKFVAIGLLHLDIIGLFQLCIPILQELSDRTGELAQLAVVEGDCVRFVAKADGKARVRVVPRIGTSAALHATAVGKVWLASLPEQTATRLALNAGLKSFAPNTITTLNKLRDELRKVRWAGYSMNNEETFVGVKGIAVPIFGRQDKTRVIGALTIVAPAFRMSEKRVTSFYPMLKGAAERLQGIECLLPPHDLRPTIEAKNEKFRQIL